MLTCCFKVYVSGEGATTTPGFLTQHWSRIKGETESALLALSKDSQFSNLRPYSLRPAGVDPHAHQEIQEYVPKRSRLVEELALPVLRAVWPGMTSPTRDLARLLTELAMGDGEKLAEGTGIGGEGRTVGNAAMRKLAGI